MGKISLILLLCIIFVVAFVEAGSSASSSSDHHEDEIGVYQLKKGNFCIKFTNFGATIISLVLPDSQGKLADVVLGFDSAEAYMNDTANFGRIVGRVANRIGGAQFTLNGTTYKLIPNDGNNTLHGGPKGFGQVIWKVRKHKQDGNSPYITFTYQSSDGEQGFPGKLLVSVTYMILGHTTLSVNMKAKAINKATPVNLAQHTYWNLGGHNSGDILSNTLQLFASHITPVDAGLIPTGEITPVKGTPYDFISPHEVGSMMDKLPHGYDINYVLDEPHKMKKVAMVHDGKSGRVMELWTNKPGVQFYTANYLKDVKGKGGFVYGPHAALCLETQGFPDSVNHPNFPSQIVYPGETYKHFMLFKFTAKQVGNM
ncbi:Aldose 1-/Glucose-6-phosphate 1-epimerase [Macleaya cordata]|uniref:Aldose 1-epimerase n=1 Tax=Macleaya cordata TaxID=56857 RepID=A0A200QS93_MACCD|nr:Aldose 1-/Glucose-6-phosphate 1-epimerase [Macleaya cordata]